VEGMNMSKVEGMNISEVEGIKYVWNDLKSEGVFIKWWRANFEFFRFF
jgi:hypothetical protein